MTGPWHLHRPWTESIRSLSARDWLPVLFVGWLIFAVLGPDKAYRVFFHGLIYPLTLYLLIRGKSGIQWRDPFLRLFLLFCAYMGITTFLVGDVPLEDDVQNLRWGIEAALGMIAFFIWMPSVVTCPRRWGIVFLSLAAAGALGGFLLGALDGVEGGRMIGFGALGHPIQASSILITFTAIGFFLLFSSLDRWSFGEVALVAVAVALVTIFTILSKSRAPIGALAVYIVFLTLLLLTGRRALLKLAAIAVALAVALVCIHWVVGLPTLIDELMDRGGSYRMEIWYAYLMYPPESVWLGNGAGMAMQYTDAAQNYLLPRGLAIAHPHNIWLGAYVETGLIGLGMQLGLFGLVVWAALRFGRGTAEKLHLLGLLSLFLMLTFTDEHSLLVSVKPIWVFGWLMLVFVWFWSWYLRRSCLDRSTRTDHQI